MRGADYSEFEYGPSRARIKHIEQGTTQVTTRYFSPLFETEGTGGTTIYRHNIFAGGQTVAIHERPSSGSAITHYLYRDHLGSVSRVTNSSGAMTQSFSFDAFGGRRNPDWSADDSQYDVTHLTERGYTGHEHLDEVRLTHMNGRVQDPKLGRFISADPFIPDPLDGQSLNRMSYVRNGPLSWTDPSGFQDQCKETRLCVPIEFGDMLGGAAERRIYEETAGLRTQIQAWVGTFGEAERSDNLRAQQLANSALVEGHWRHILTLFANVFRRAANAEMMSINTGAILLGPVSSDDLLGPASNSTVTFVEEEIAPITTPAVPGVGLAGGLISRGKWVSRLDDVPNGGPIWQSSRLDAAKFEHIFSRKHLQRGVLDLGDSPQDVLNRVRDNVLRADMQGLLKQGDNTIRTTINGHRATIRANFDGNELRSLDVFKGNTARDLGNVIDLP